MKDMGIVQGSKAQAKSVIVGKHIVYEHTDITPIDIDGETFYSYHEKQYTKDEWIDRLTERSLEEANTTKQQIADVEDALCELAELLNL